MHRQLFDALVEAQFRRLFVVIFWYAVLGPLLCRTVKTAGGRCSAAVFGREAAGEEPEGLQSLLLRSRVRGE